VPTIEIVETYPLAVSALFAFFLRPANVLAVAPEGSGLRLVEGPDVVALGTKFTVAVRRWGLSRQIVTEVVELVPDERVVEEQRNGPFAAWRLGRHFRPVDGGCELREVVTFEAPGGLLGLMLTAARIEAELRTAYEGRRDRVLAALPFSTQTST
jgi:ligand-binding SRPBCC domain-containing protein